MKKKLQNLGLKNSSRKSLGTDFPIHGVPAPDACSLERAVWVQSPPSQPRDERIAGLPLSSFVGREVVVPCQTDCGLVEHLNIRVVAAEDDALVGDLDEETLVASELKGAVRVKVMPAQVVWVQQPVGQWQSAVARLREGADYHNPWRGEPTGWLFDQLYDAGHSPEHALEMWRDWEPWDEYSPACFQPWPPHDRD